MATNRIRIFVRHNPTMVSRFWCEDQSEPWNDETSDFLWSEGNYACDCNRSLFFNRAGDEPDDKNHSCGNEVYSLMIEDAVTGERLYADDDWDELKEAEVA